MAATAHDRDARLDLGYTTQSHTRSSMTPGETQPRRRLLAAVAMLALFALSGCDIRRPIFGYGDAPPSAPNFGWGSGWGGNRDWGGASESGMGGR
jgi:hypothetical protein